ncbi:hypothetical protein MASR2M16_21620 [Thauera terpenica]
MDVPDLIPIPTANPIIHDQSNGLRIGHPDNPEKHHISREVREGDSIRTEWELLRAEDRAVRGAVSGTTQRTMDFTDFGPEDKSMVNADTHAYITYKNRPLSNNPGHTWNALRGNQTGTVDIVGYMEWLKDNRLRLHLPMTDKPALNPMRKPKMYSIEASNPPVSSATPHAAPRRDHHPEQLQFRRQKNTAGAN